MSCSGLAVKCFNAHRVFFSFQDLKWTLSEIRFTKNEWHPTDSLFISQIRRTQNHSDLFLRDNIRLVT